MKLNRYGAAVLTLMLVLGAPALAESTLMKNLKAGKEQVVITYGTSLTAGGAWVKQIQQAFNDSYPGKVKVINSGKGAMWSKWGVDNLDKRVIEKKPDTVLIEFGINDAFLRYETPVEQARKNLENMIERIHASNAECEIVLMVMNPPIGVHLERRPRISEYYQMYRDVAAAKKLLLIDHYPAWEKILNKGESDFRKLVPDGIHPNAEGCKSVITPNILKALGLPSAAH